MANAKKECCYNCRYYSRMWNFCGCPYSKENRNAELVGEYHVCVNWEEDEEGGNEA